MNSVKVEIFKIRDKVTGKFSRGGSFGGICRNHSGNISANEGRQYGVYATDLVPETNTYFKRLYEFKPQFWAKSDKNGHGGHIWHRLRDLNAHLSQHGLTIETLPDRFEVWHGTVEISPMCLNIEK